MIGLAHDANGDEFADFEWANTPETIIERAFPDGREVVVYVGLQLDSAHEGARLAVRTLQDFFAAVCISREHRHYGKEISGDDLSVCDWTRRFSYVGPRFIDGMQVD